jgi:hypothetical protein
VLLTNSDEISAMLLGSSSFQELHLIQIPNCRSTKLTKAQAIFYERIFSIGEPGKKICVTLNNKVIKPALQNNEAIS